MILDAKSYDRLLQVLNKYLKKYGYPKTSQAKIELLHTHEELHF
jgi:hypothetical protein